MVRTPRPLLISGFGHGINEIFAHVAMRAKFACAGQFIVCNLSQFTI